MIAGGPGGGCHQGGNSRPRRPCRATANQQGGFSVSFLNNNRNKRSITLELKRTEGRDLLHRMAAAVDVLVQNFRPGVVERLGIAEADVRPHAPRLIYVSMSGFGADGPYVHKPVYDPIIQAVWRRYTLAVAPQRR